jgi:hypothetical protein
MAIAGQYFVISVVTQSDQSKQLINLYYYKPQAVVEGDDKAEIANKVATAFGVLVQAAWKAVMPSECSWGPVICYFHDDANVYESTYDAENGPGAVSGDSCPDFTAAVVQKRTATGGRSGRGRWYLGCVAESNTDTGRLTTAAVALYKTLAGNFAIDLTTDVGDLTPCLFAQAAAMLYPITGIVVNSPLGTQRRRRLRR